MMMMMSSSLSKPTWTVSCPSQNAIYMDHNLHITLKFGYQDLFHSQDMVELRLGYTKPSMEI
jgi:hypothetical protein